MIAFHGYVAASRWGTPTPGPPTYCRHATANATVNPLPQLLQLPLYGMMLPWQLVPALRFAEVRGEELLLGAERFLLGDRGEDLMRVQPALCLAAWQCHWVQSPTCRRPLS